MTLADSDDGHVVVSDLERHAIINIILETDSKITVGKCDSTGFDDGSVEVAFIKSPTGIYHTGSSIHLAKIPRSCKICTSYPISE